MKLNEGLLSINLFLMKMQHIRKVIKMYQDGRARSKIIDKCPTQQQQERKFEFPGSYLHEIPNFPFRIEKMSLKINPDFKKKILAECTQDLTVRFLKNTIKIELDIGELKILNVTSPNIRIKEFECIDDKKLVISLLEAAEEGKSVNISILYSAGYYQREGIQQVGTPRNGFHFIAKEDSTEGAKAYQAWTQGETTESKYWFPCLDSPHVKFILDIEITAPIDFDVISNGVLVSKAPKNIDQMTWKYVEVNPLPAYLVSVVVGKFSKEETNHGEIPILYYWPEDIAKDNAMLTFSETPKMIKFFEEYFGTKYPFRKYAQVAVDNFEFGGMENLSCTTLTRRVLHDKKTSLDYKNDLLLIIHELAHQWFGDLVTCKGWPHIWLNEGFATYCESLYLESSRGVDEFHYSLIESTDVYFEEANEYYIRPIVTNLYKHPDELFDAHSYEKAGFILHMLRNFLGEDKFKSSLTQYLSRFQNSSVTSIHLLETIEDVSGIQIQRFFDQWIYRKGHPEIDIEYALIKDTSKNTNEQVNKLKIKITQSQNHAVNQESFIPPYQFQLEIKVKLQDISRQTKEIIHLVQISQWNFETFIDFDSSYSVLYISVDPHFKILKSIKSIKVKDESKDFQLKKILLDQLKKGDTVIERIDSARLLKDIYHGQGDIIDSLVDAIQNDKFYGVSKEAANTIGSYQDNKNFEKSDKAFQVLYSLVMDKESFSNLNNQVKRAIIKNIGLFERTESVQILESVISDPKIDSDFIKSAASVALGKSCKKNSNIHEKKRIMSVLKDIVTTSKSFQSVLATGALDGMVELSKDDNQLNIKEIYIETINFLLQNTGYLQDYFIRAKCTRLLGKYLLNKFDIIDPKLAEINEKVFCRLKELLKDERRKIKTNACEALSDNDSRFASFPVRITYESIEILIEVAREDLDGFVRRKAETSANQIREWIHRWSSEPLQIKQETRP